MSTAEILRATAALFDAAVDLPGEEPSVNTSSSVGQVSLQFDTDDAAGVEAWATLLDDTYADDLSATWDYREIVGTFQGVTFDLWAPLHRCTRSAS